MGVILEDTFNYFAREHRAPTEAADALRWLLDGRPEPVQKSAINGQLGEVDSIERIVCPRLVITPSNMFGPRTVKVAYDGEVAWMNAPLTLRVLPEPSWLLKAVNRTVWATWPDDTSHPAPLLHERHVRRLLRSSCDGPARGHPLSGDQNHRPGRCQAARLNDIRNDLGCFVCAGSGRVASDRRAPSPTRRRAQS